MKELGATASLVQQSRVLTELCQQAEAYLGVLAVLLGPLKFRSATALHILLNHTVQFIYYSITMH